MVTEKMIEQRMLLRSAALMAFVAVSGTIMGIVSNSDAILLDGICSFLDVIIKGMMILTSHLVAQETSQRFQFGYWQFEPLVLFLEGSFILLIVIYSLVSGIMEVLSGGRAVEMGSAIGYAIGITILECIYWVYAKRVNKRLKSNLVQYDTISWTVDIQLEAGIFLSFVIGYCLKFTSWHSYAVYVDPIVLIILSLQLVPSTVQILLPATRQILGMAPQGTHRRVQEIMDRFMETYHFADYVSSVQAYGHAKIIEIDILLPKDYPIQSVRDFDRIRDEINEEIGGQPLEKWVTITFTTTWRWMARDYTLDDDDE